MGNNFKINKSGLPEDELLKKIGAVPDKITTAEASENFSCVEPVFEEKNGGLFGGDMSAFERLQQLLAQRNEEANLNSVASMNFVPEPCCQ